MNHRVVTLVPLLLSVLVSPTLWAKAASVGFSEYRLLLTKDKKSDHLTLINKGQEQAQCDLGLNHFQVQPNNSLKALDGPELAHNPAHKLLRYSPRRVQIPAEGTQKVRLNFRRKAKLADGEYTSYLNITCVASDDAKGEGGEVGAVISYNIPVHLRTGALEANTHFDTLAVKKISTDRFQLKIRQYRQGTRSLIGDVQVMDNQTGAVLARQANIGIYPPAEYYDYNISFTAKPSQGVTFTFTESPEFGGQLTKELKIAASYF